MNHRHWLVFALCCVSAVAVACGGDGDDTTADSAATIAARTVAAGGEPGVVVDTTTSPVLGAPVSRYTVLHEEVGPAFRNLVAATFDLDLERYSDAGTFRSKAEGRQLLSEWGYIGGFEESLVADGGQSDVLNGGFDFTVESHLFNDEEGAMNAFIYFEQIVKANKKTTVTTIDPVGNQSSAWTLIDGKFPNTSIDVAYHRVIFRRGNLVVIVKTEGAASFMTIDDAYALAMVVDKKALGEIESVTPTPVSNYTPPVGSKETTVPGITPAAALTPTVAAP